MTLLSAEAHDRTVEKRKCPRRTWMWIGGSKQSDGLSNVSYSTREWPCTRVLRYLCCASTPPTASRGGITGRVLLASVALRCVSRASVCASSSRPPTAGHATLAWIPPARILVQIRRHLAPATPWGPGSRSHAHPPLSSSARIAARNRRTRRRHVPAEDSIIRPCLCLHLLASPETAATTPIR